MQTFAKDLIIANRINLHIQITGNIQSALLCVCILKIKILLFFFFGCFFILSTHLDIFD